jgi:hypothetical protein
MSHIPAVVAELARAACESAKAFETCAGIELMSLHAPPRSPPLPLSLRPSHELRARAAELSQMAATARTAEAKTALETLAARFEAVAAQRALAEALVPKRDDGQSDPTIE